MLFKIRENTNYLCFVTYQVSNVWTQQKLQKVEVVSTNLYFVPKAVVLGDAKSVCTDGILDEGPILHHMITVENTQSEYNDIKTVKMPLSKGPYLARRCK